LEHKRTLPLKAGPGSFKRLLGSVPSTDADYYAPSSAAAASCRAGRHSLQSAEELLTSTATTVRRRSNPTRFPIVRPHSAQVVSSGTAWRPPARRVQSAQIIPRWPLR